MTAIPDMIYVANPDRMCFWVYAETLEPASVSYYDPYVFSQREYSYITTSEWTRRRDEMRRVNQAT